MSRISKIVLPDKTTYDLNTSVLKFTNIKLNQLTLNSSSDTKYENYSYKYTYTNSQIKAEYIP